MAGSAGLAAGMTALASAILGEESLAASLTSLAELSVQSVAVSGAGVTWPAARGQAVVRGSQGFAERLELAQHAAGQGPGVQAYAAQQVVRAAIDVSRPGWAQFGKIAAGEGVRDVLAAPLTSAGCRLGTLSFYTRSAAGFEDSVAAQAVMFAEHAAHLLACSRQLAESRSMTRNLRQAMESRAAIEQAKGIVMAREYCDPQRAFDLLRATSQCSHVKLCEVAQALVGSVAGHHATPPGRSFRPAPRGHPRRRGTGLELKALDAEHYRTA